LLPPSRSKPASLWPETKPFRRAPSTTSTPKAVRASERPLCCWTFIDWWSSSSRSGLGVSTETFVTMHSASDSRAMTYPSFCLTLIRRASLCLFAAPRRSDDLCSLRAVTLGEFNLPAECTGHYDRRAKVRRPDHHPPLSSPGAGSPTRRPNGLMISVCRKGESSIAKKSHPQRQLNAKRVNIDA
jgi:hypothetical protein